MVRSLASDRHISEMKGWEERTCELTSLPSISSLSGNFGQSEMCAVGKPGKKQLDGNAIISDHGRTEMDGDGW